MKQAVQAVRACVWGVLLWRCSAEQLAAARRSGAAHMHAYVPQARAWETLQLASAALHMAMVVKTVSLSDAKAE